jgi:transcription antitermination factor NusG
VQRKAAFKAGELVRIKKGLYTGDLGKIHKIYKHRIDILVVPRLGMQLIREEMRKVESTFPET